MLVDHTHTHKHTHTHTHIHKHTHTHTHTHTHKHTHTHTHTHTLNSIIPNHVTEKLAAKLFWSQAFCLHCKNLFRWVLRVFFRISLKEIEKSINYRRNRYKPNRICFDFFVLVSIYYKETFFPNEPEKNMVNMVGPLLSTDNHSSRGTTFPTRVHVRQAKLQVSRVVASCVWVARDPSFL